MWTVVQPKRIIQVVVECVGIAQVGIASYLRVVQSSRS